MLIVWREFSSDFSSHLNDLRSFLFASAVGLVGNVVGYAKLGQLTTIQFARQGPLIDASGTQLDLTWVGEEDKG